MNNQQYLLLKLAEECSEITQLASKTIQFGFESVGPSTSLTNKERLHEELNDLLGVVKLLNEDVEFEYVPDPVKVDAKQVKVKKYHKISKDLGFVE